MAFGLRRGCTTEARFVHCGRIATKRLISRDSALGYKRRIGVPQFTSASPPANETAYAVICSGGHHNLSGNGGALS